MGVAQQAWDTQLAYCAYEVVGHARTEQLFDLVVDWPDSQPALRDLADCLERTSLRAHLVQRFRAAIQQRLLHAGGGGERDHSQGF